MSRETLSWLNESTLIGFTEKRGNAWHHRQGTDNHYPGAVPIADVRKRLFHWTAEERPVYIPETVEAVGGGWTTTGEYLDVPGRKAIVRSDTGSVLGIFSDGYQPHDYDEWLLGSVENMLDADLQIGSAGLLKGGALGWVQVEVPDTFTTPSGVAFRPFLLARASFDGSVSTTYSRAVTNVVCDNTMAIAAGEHAGQKISFRSRGNSEVKLGKARDALGIVYSAADDFAAQVAELTAISFHDYDFRRLAELRVPLPEDPKKAPAAYKAATEKRDYLYDLYRFDARVAPWTGTAYGAWQAFNTYDQHERKLRKATNRVERNQLQAVRGQQDKADAEVLEQIIELAA